MTKFDTDPPFLFIASIFFWAIGSTVATVSIISLLNLSADSRKDLDYFLTFLFVFANFTEEEEVEVDVVTIENSSKREQEETQELIEPENEKSCATIDEPETSQACSEILGLEEQQEADDDDEKTNFVGKIRTRRHRKVLSSDGLNYRDGKKLVKNMSSSGESDESENDSEFTRATHNVLERKRRNDLKMKFQKLRDCVPELKDNDRAPKVSILRKSWEYISQIKQEEIKLLAELEKQKKINAVLLRKLLAMNQAN